MREALALINQTLVEVFAEQDDADTRRAVAWFEQMDFSEGEFGTVDVRKQVTQVSARTLSRAER